MITKEVKTYDFNKPEKISKDQLRNLQILHENFARITTVDWSAMLRSVVQVKLVNVSQAVFSEVSASWAEFSCIGVLDISPLTGNMVVFISPDFIFALVDRLLGGQGRKPNKIREFTDLEQMLIRRLFNVLLQAVRETWHALIKLDPKVEEIETNAQFIQSFSPNESVLLCEYTAQFNDVEGKIDSVVSFISLEELLPKLSAEHMMKMGVAGGGRIGEKGVMDIEMPLIVGFPGFVLGLQQILSLKKGDIIDTRVPVQDKVMVWINNKPIFKGKLGRCDDKLAVKVLDRVVF